MPFPIESKCVIAISASALFDMHEAASIFESEGIDAYREYQEKNADEVLSKGAAFPFVRRLLKLNETFPEISPIEIILLSQNSPETGVRVFNSIRHYNLNITRAVFSSGRHNFQYLPAFNATIFLSANPEETKKATKAGYTAGTVLSGTIIDDDFDDELRVAFDFDGVIVDDSAERVYQEKGMTEYMSHESSLAGQPLDQGPVYNLLQKLSEFQKMEADKHTSDPSYTPKLITSIVTARNAPAHQRVLTTLKNMNIQVNELFFMGGIEKARVLEIMKPHLFLDDQMTHLASLKGIPAVHIPFGINNQEDTIR